ncbi:hypothetical protein HPB52_006184 [Rhipicephalus sanguineus]|uniref:DUF4806 domain-containing protein n=1 Tax=Rhipicephalus sanguineus TaxID=34632 RepID=A0A9D4QDL5_RHISA|nr:hypothetical protein HPB52_006184 [Rhipicephalus sanguineus]
MTEQHAPSKGTNANKADEVAAAAWPLAKLEDLADQVCRICHGRRIADVLIIVLIIFTAFCAMMEYVRGTMGYERYKISLHTIRLLVKVRQEQQQGFNSLRAETQQLSARLDSIQALLARRGQPVLPAARLQDLPELPATSLEELEDAEAALEDKDVASALRDHLTRLGGKDLREVAVNVLTAIMNNSVQRLFSMHGKKGKREFTALRLCEVATDVISRKAGVDIAAVEGFIKKRLPGSADRGVPFDPCPCLLSSCHRLPLQPRALSSQ